MSKPIIRQVAELATRLETSPDNVGFLGETLGGLPRERAFRNAVIDVTAEKNPASDQAVSRPVQAPARPSIATETALLPPNAPQAVVRGKHGQFVKGRSGNPSGRPKEIADLVKAARSHSGEALKKLVDLMRVSGIVKITPLGN